ncbi:SRPBCC domain-containing protein [Actinokineospora iranica]|uniref:Uncharacterized conserved protein YndB, AHSA1/START domain n=1 Tax=Actinokineospora iranica TaxID=1271860 RepID=A0A1G6IS30_9PSEU|nr:SRPBCC domain-containing protein [Actinokineospora iranica]SDC08815.1 Uncharacterized conserved protein YndB, AHSA1/START domain [Actinokineospora iranica]
MDATLRTDAGRCVLRFTRALAHPPDKVWRAITEPDHLAHWFPATLTGERRPEAPITFTFAFDDGTDGGSGVITDYDPPRLFAFTWQGENLRFDLRPTDDGCLLVFTHRFDDRPGAASFAAGWEGCLAALTAHLDGAPTPDYDWAAAHETYTARFGLLHGTAQPDGDTWLVRFERQLTVPADQVWPHLAALAGGRPVTENAPDTLLTRHDTGDTVQIDLTPGPGGARLLLTHRLLTHRLPTHGLPTHGLPTHGLPTHGLPTHDGPTEDGTEDRVVTALVHWHTAIRALAARLMGTTPGAPDDDLDACYRHTIEATMP